VTAVTTYDFADRPASLLAQRAGKPDQPLVSSASYLPYGPLQSLTLGNGLTETHSGTTDTYTYELVPPPGTGHSPILSSVALGAGGTKTYQYDAAGNLQQITQGTAATAFTNDDAGHLAALAATSPVG
jgi:YD repeat-containing protein